MVEHGDADEEVAGARAMSGSSEAPRTHTSMAPRISPVHASVSHRIRLPRPVRSTASMRSTSSAHASRWVRSVVPAADTTSAASTARRRRGPAHRSSSGRTRSARSCRPSRKNAVGGPHRAAARSPRPTRRATPTASLQDSASRSSRGSLDGRRAGVREREVGDRGDPVGECGQRAPARRRRRVARGRTPASSPTTGTAPGRRPDRRPACACARARRGDRSWQRRRARRRCRCGWPRRARSHSTGRRQASGTGVARGSRGGRTTRRSSRAWCRAVGARPRPIAKSIGDGADPQRRGSGRGQLDRGGMPSSRRQRSTTAARSNVARSLRRRRPLTEQIESGSRRLQ